MELEIQVDKTDKVVIDKSYEKITFTRSRTLVFDFKPLFIPEVVAVPGATVDLVEFRENVFVKDLFQFVEFMTQAQVKDFGIHSWIAKEGDLPFLRDKSLSIQEKMIRSMLWFKARALKE